MAIVDLLDILQDLLVGGLIISGALLSGMLALAQDIVNFLVDPDSGLLTRPLDIPIISDLFKLIIGDDLTFFNLIVLVASIPISILYRVIEGAWPADQFAAAMSGARLDTSSATVLARMFGIMETVCYFGNGIFAPAADMFVAEDETPPILNYILIGLSIGTTIPSAYGITDHAEGTYLAIEINQTIVGALGDQELFKQYAPALLMVCALAAIVTAIVEKVDKDVSWASFSGDVLGEIPTFVRPLQYQAQEFPFTITILLATIDMAVNNATALADFIALVQSWDAEQPTALPPGEEPPSNLPGQSYLPFVQGAP
jgi:hypothetical protein